MSPPFENVTEFELCFGAMITGWLIFLNNNVKMHLEARNRQSLPTDGSPLHDIQLTTKYYPLEASLVHLSGYFLSHIQHCLWRKTESPTMWHTQFNRYVPLSDAASWFVIYQTTQHHIPESHMDKLYFSIVWGNTTLSLQDKYVLFITVNSHSRHRTIQTYLVTKRGPYWLC